MYSVLIQNEETYNSFADYQPFFSKSCNDGKIGVCKWIESGANIETALPELPSLVNDKEEWCAVIVRTVDESKRAGYLSDMFNPYDFDASKTCGKESLEDIPLVRLTHILGGIPPYNIDFKTVTVKEKYKANRVVFEPNIDKKNYNAHNELKEKYSYDGRKPSLIVIVTLRFVSQDNISLESVWETRKESESSEFWKRNTYPNICRFTVCDVSDEGPVQRDADKMNMWLSVLMLCLNYPDSSVLQANRLYKLSCDFDKDIMEDNFQNVIYKLKSNKYYIEKSLDADKNQELSIEEKIPDYRVPCSVQTKKPNFKDILIRSNRFKLLSRGKFNDFGIWKHHKLESERSLIHCVKDSERKLDQAAEAIKPKCNVRKDEIEKVNKYQYEDMQIEARELYRTIIEQQGVLPEDNFKSNKKMRTAEKIINDILKNRLTRKTFLLTLIIIAVILLFVNLPGLISHFVLNQGSLTGFFSLFVVEWFVVFVSAIFLVLFEKSKLKSALNMFNMGLKEELIKLVSNVSLYSDYISNIASFSKLTNYLRLTNKNDDNKLFENISKMKHLKAIDSMLHKIKKWGVSYHLDLDLDAGFTDNNDLYDYTVNPSESSLYNLATSQTFTTEINHSGIPLDSPYEYIKNVNIAREEVYDD